MYHYLYQNLSDENKVYDFSKSVYEIELPKRMTVLPRHKPAPKKDQYQTKWEKFAKDKGIEKKKSKIFNLRKQISP